MAITHHRQHDDLVDAFGTAETLLRERQVSGNAQHHGVVEARGALIELAYRHRAGRRVDRRKDIEDLALAGVGRRRDILEIGADQLEARRLIADRRQITIGAERVAMQGDGCHLRAPVVLRENEDRSEEHTSELQSLMRISYAVFCLKKKKTTNKNTTSGQKQNVQHTHTNTESRK